MIPWEPHSYQRKCVKHLLAHPGAGLLLDPGLGKTSIVLQAITMLLGDVIDAALVIAPLRVCTEVWPVEARKWEQFAHLSVGVLHGSKKDRVLREEHDLYVINPEGLFWLERQRGWDWPQMLVVDESTKFKNTRSQRFKALRGKLNHFDRRVILTGTPIPNGLLDLYGQVFLLDGGKRLGDSYYRYRNRYFTETGWMGREWKAKPDALEDVQEVIGDICIRMEAEDYLDMPDQIVEEVIIPLPKKAMGTYATLEAAFYAELEGGSVTVANAATLSTKLRQIVGGAVYTDEDAWVSAHTAKLDACADLVEEIGAPTIIAYEYDHERERLLDLFPDSAVLAGGKRHTRETIAAWNAGELPVLLCHPASAGHGLNLQAGGHHLIWYSVPWNLEHYDQMNARLWRQGQEHPVFVYHLIGKDTIDERVSQVLQGKDRTQRALLEGLK